MVGWYGGTLGSIDPSQLQYCWFDPDPKLGLLPVRSFACYLCVHMGFLQAPQFPGLATGSLVGGLAMLNCPDL